MSKTANDLKDSKQQTASGQTAQQTQQTQQAAPQQTTSRQTDKPLDGTAKSVFEECLSKLTSMVSDNTKVLSDHDRILADHDKMFATVNGKIANLDERVDALEHGDATQSTAKADVNANTVPAKGVYQPVNQVSPPSCGGVIEVNSADIGRLVFRIPGATITMTQR